MSRVESPSAIRAPLPRWYAHRYNRSELYRLVAAATRWLPRPTRLELARRIGHLAPRVLPAERAAVRNTLSVMTGAVGSRLDELTRDVFGEFAMCFSDLIVASRRPARVSAHMGPVRGIEQLLRQEGAVVSLTAHVGNWELAGRLLAQHSARSAPTASTSSASSIRCRSSAERRRTDYGRGWPTSSASWPKSRRSGSISSTYGIRSGPRRRGSRRDGPAAGRGAAAADQRAVHERVRPLQHALRRIRRRPRALGVPRGRARGSGAGTGHGRRDRAARGPRARPSPGARRVDPAA